MFTQEVTVNNEVGLHARPATYFIQKANEFKSGIWVEKEERRVNAKSLLGVLSLGIVKGTTITLIADGPDAKEAVEALVQLVNGLCEKYRTPLVMHFYLELSDREIAQALSITENYVSVLCLRGRKILQRQLKELREKEGQV